MANYDRHATFWHGFSNLLFQQYLKLSILNDIQIRLQKDFTPIHVVALFNTKLGSEPAKLTQQMVMMSKPVARLGIS